MIFDLENVKNDKHIRGLEDDHPFDLSVTGDVSTALRVNGVIQKCLDEIQLASDIEKWKEETLNFGQRLEFYDPDECDIICRHFTDGVLECLRHLLSAPDGDNTALFLIYRNTNDARDRESWGGIGKVIKGSTTRENI